MSFFQRFLENGPEKAGNESVPYRATYAASKGFGLLFAEALAREVEDHGVRVCALCPGPTESEFPKVAGLPDDLLFATALQAEGLIEVSRHGGWTVTQAGDTMAVATAARPVTQIGRAHV